MSNGVTCVKYVADYGSSTIVKHRMAQILIQKELKVTDEGIKCKDWLVQAKFLAPFDLMENINDKCKTGY